MILDSIQNAERYFALNARLKMVFDFLATAGYDPEFGARPVKRAIQRYLLNDLSKKLLSLSVDRSKPIFVERDTDGLKFRN